MSGRLQAIIAIVCAVGCIGFGAAMFTNRGSVKSYLDDNFSRTSVTSAVPGATSRSLTYATSLNPTDAARTIAGKWKPAERQDQSSGSFLRYKSAIVAVTPNPSGGSYISYDDPNDGYARWFNYVGGGWGTSLGQAESTRGGGSGSGK